MGVSDEAAAVADAGAKGSAERPEAAAPNEAAAAPDKPEPAAAKDGGSGGGGGGGAKPEPAAAKDGGSGGGGAKPEPAEAAEDAAEGEEAAAAAADGGEEEGEQEPPGPQIPNLLLFRKWNLEGIEVHDPGLVSAISLRRMILPYTYGRSALKKFNKAEANIVERLANKMMHFGKRYAKNTGRMAGKKTSVMRTVEAAFEIIHIQTGRNPVEVLVRAVEHSAPNEDTTRIVYGGAVYHVSVDVSPLRRVDLALRFIADGVKEAAFSRPRAVEECLADHLMLAAANDQNAPSVKKKHELERIAQASR